MILYVWWQNYFQANHETNFLYQLFQQNQKTHIFVTSEATWLMQLMRQSTTLTITICSKSKHINIEYHIVKEQVNANRIRLERYPSEETLAHMFTKALNDKQLKIIC